MEWNVCIIKKEFRNDNFTNFAQTRSVHVFGLRSSRSCGNMQEAELAGGGADERKIAISEFTFIRLKNKQTVKRLGRQRPQGHKLHCSAGAVLRADRGRAPNEKCAPPQWPSILAQPP